VEFGWAVSALSQAAARRGGRCRAGGQDGAVCAEAPTPLRCSGSWPHGKTRYAGCARCAQTLAVSQLTKRAARAGHEPSAPRRPRLPPSPTPPAAQAPALVLGDDPRRLFAKAGAVGRCRAFAQPRSAGLSARARSALRGLTHGNCLSAAGRARVASFAVGPEARAPQGTPAQRGPATKRHRPTAPAFARANASTA
jgi:hypothetical protein